MRHLSDYLQETGRTGMYHGEIDTVAIGRSFGDPLSGWLRPSTRNLWADIAVDLAVSVKVNSCLGRFNHVLQLLTNDEPMCKYLVMQLNYGT